MAEYIPIDDLFDPEKGRDEIITVFDGLMGAVEKHIKQEYDAQRIRGTDYANVYTSAMQATLGNAVQYLLGMALNDEQRDELLSRTKQTKYVTDTQLPAQVEQTNAQTDLISGQLSEINYRVSNILPKESLLLTSQKEQTDTQTDLISDVVLSTCDVSTSTSFGSILLTL
jgi:hypothetical protein